MRSRAIPAAMHASARPSRKSRTSRTTSAYAGACCMLAGSPCMCIRQTPTPPCTHASSAPGDVNADTSLIIAAPAAIAARITAGLRVSTDTATPSPASVCVMPDDPRHLFVLGDRHGARARRLAADVDQVGAIRHHPTRVIERLRRVEVEAAVRERVGRDVEDPHHERARQVERVAAADELTRHRARVELNVTGIEARNRGRAPVQRTRSAAAGARIVNHPGFAGAQPGLHARRG